ncbi:MAG: GNAT family N-acetyltransferase [Alistipes senegalensis]
MCCAGPASERRAIIAYGAVAFDGEPAYEALEGEWLTHGPYVVVHRMAVADGECGKGVAAEFLRHAEEMARERGIGAFASTPTMTTVPCCGCSNAWD